MNFNQKNSDPKIFNIFRKTIHSKLESTNNKIEHYFGNALDKHTKRIPITSEGIFDYIEVKMDGLKTEKSLNK